MTIEIFSSKIKSNIGLTVFNAVSIYPNKVVKRKSNTVINRYSNKISKLRLERRLLNLDTTSFIKQIAHNYSSYNLSREEEKALSLRLHEHIPSNINRNQLFAELGLLYQNILPTISDIPEENQIKLNIIALSRCSECEKYSSIKVPWKYQEIINNLKSNQNIILVERDKGRCVDLFDKNKYRMKNKFTDQEFQRLYPSGSNA